MIKKHPSSDMLLGCFRFDRARRYSVLTGVNRVVAAAADALVLSESWTSSPSEN